ncbi:putative DNA ligase (ATP) [Helianthus anomalus]
MLPLRSCCFTATHTTTTTTITTVLCNPIKHHLLKLKPLSYSKMSSSRPSAFDALMCNARAAASKNKTPSSSSSSSFSPKKRKTLISKSPISPTPVTELKHSEDEIHESNFKKVDKNQIKDEINESNGTNEKNPNPNFVQLEEQKVLKKLKLVNVDESLVELKKKPGEFDPEKAGYWGAGERVPFMFVVKVFDEISRVSGRIVITEMVCNMLRTVVRTTPDDLVAVVYLLANRIAPAHEGLELGIGDASLIKALAEACGANEAHIKKQYKELGDLGLVAKASRLSQPLMRKPQPLTVAKVFDTFRVIAKESGKDSQDKKKNHIKGLLVAATDCEPQYLIRLLQTKLRIGLAEQTLLTPLGHAIFYTEKHPSPPACTGSPLEEAAKIVKQVYSVIPVYDKIVPALLSGGVWDLPKTCCFSPGVPVGPMLAKPTKGVSEILDKFQNMEFTCEYKYDGERAQINYLEDGTVQIYNRNAERNTEKFPDVVVAASR